MQFHKKPVTIEAWHYVQDNPEGLPIWLKQAFDEETVVHGDYGTLLIETLEGVMTVSPDDWIIQGVQGELYPCKPDIFVDTYEPTLGIDLVSVDDDIEEDMVHGDVKVALMVEGHTGDLYWYPVYEDDDMEAVIDDLQEPCEVDGDNDWVVVTARDQREAFIKVAEYYNNQDNFPSELQDAIDQANDEHVGTDNPDALLQIARGNWVRNSQYIINEVTHDQGNGLDDVIAALPKEYPTDADIEQYLGDTFDHWYKLAHNRGEITW